MLVKQFRTGGDRNFGYLAGDETTKMAVVIDPSYSPDMIADYADENGYMINYIFITHNHYDHTNGNKEIERRTGIKPLLFGNKDPKTNMLIMNDAVLPLGSLKIKIIHTPGHTEDSICVFVGDAIFTGDTLFVGKIGGTDFGRQAKTEYDSLHNKLMTLPDEIRVFPGHDYGIAPESTIAREKKSNPFLVQPDFDSFLHLKMNWAEYKREHGIQ